MIDEEALICDLAETYGIYNYRDLPPLTVAVFCKGLRENSRMKMKLSSQSVSMDTMLLASIVDRLSYILWSKTKDGEKNRNKPKSLVDIFNKSLKEKEEQVFVTGEEFEKMRSKILMKGD